MPLETYTTLAATDLLAEGIVARMLAGISTRRYTVALEPVGSDVEQAAQATSKSAVSRRFVNATAERLAELHSQPLGDQRWLVVYLDGFSFGDHTLIGALGVTGDGTKVPLGVVEGSTENAAVCTRLVSDLAARGLDATRGILFVIDGGKAIAKAVNDVYGRLAVTARCRIHKERNILDHLPEAERPLVRRKLREAWAKTSAVEATIDELSVRWEVDATGPARSVSPDAVILRYTVGYDNCARHGDASGRAAPGGARGRRQCWRAVLCGGV